MSSEGPKKGFAFVIDTDSYAGNFEREMCAYLTGHVGECEVGEEYVDEDLPMNFDNVLDVGDDHGCYRPVSIWMNEPKTSYESVAIFFDTKPTQEQIDFMKERAKGFNDEVYNENKDSSWYKRQDIVVLGFRLIQFKSGESSTDV